MVTRLLPCLASARVRQVCRKTRSAHLYTAAAGQAWRSPCQRWTPRGCIRLWFCQTWSRTFGASPFVFLSSALTPSLTCAHRKTTAASSSSLLPGCLTALETRWRTRAAHSHDLDQTTSVLPWTNVRLWISLLLMKCIILGNLYHLLLSS